MKTFVFHVIFICSIQNSMGSPLNEDTSNQTQSNKYEPLLESSDIHVTSSERNETTLDSVSAERLLSTVSGDNGWKYPMFASEQKTPFCSTTPTAIFKAPKAHRPLTNRLFAEKKIIIPNEVGETQKQFIHFRHLLPRRMPIFITLLKCRCYVITQRNFYPIIKESSRRTEQLTKSPTTEEPTERSGRIEQTTTATSEESGGVPPEIKISPTTEEPVRVDQSELNLNIQKSLPESISGMVSALDVSSNEICVDNKFVFLSRGVAGDSSFFVYANNDSGMYVIAHLVFN